MDRNDNVFTQLHVCESPEAHDLNDCTFNASFPSVPVTHTFTAAATYEPPQGELEEELARIWSETLKTSPIGRNDGFIELGGDSLLGTTVLHKIQEVFGIELPLRTIFELQTIKTIAETIDNIYIGTIGDSIEENIF